MSLLDAAKLEGAPTDLTTVKWNPSESSLVLGTLTGSVLLYAFKKRAKVAASTQLGLGLPVTHLAWHPAGGLVLVGLTDSRLCLLTCGLHSLSLLHSKSAPRSIPFPGSAPQVDLALSLGYDRGHELAVVDWAVADPDQAGVEGGAQEPCLALMVLEGGPVALLRMDGRRGSSVSGGARPVGVAREMLAQGLVQSAVETAICAGSSREQYLALNLVFYSLLRSRGQPSDGSVPGLLDQAAGAIAELVASLQGSTAGRPSAGEDRRLLAGGRGMCRIYCQRLLAEHRMESAFTLAHHLADAAILEDIYIHAIRNGAVRLAAVVHGRLVKVLGPDVSPEDRPLSVEDLSALNHLQQEVQAVKVPEHGADSLSHEEVMMLGSQLEGQGFLDAACELYSQMGMDEDLQRLSSLIAAGFTTE